MKLEMKGIRKSFGGVSVLKGVDLSLEGGEICALLGENGAGKSTLMNVLGGVLRPDGGEIFIDGRRTAFAQPVESLDSGIAFIHQELNLINDLPVYENMFLGRREPRRRGLLDHAKMRGETERFFETLGMDLNPSAMVRDLDASYKQIVEISRAIMMNASIIIMDEPTSSLTDPEIERVFKMAGTLRGRGVGIIFISHKLREVKHLCDRYVVLRDGQKVAEGSVADVSTDDLARFMVGHDVRTESLQSARARSGDSAGESVLRCENIGDLSAARFFRDISLEVRAGEVLGVTGLLGDGRSELFLSIFGSGSSYEGQIFIGGKPVKKPREPARAIDLGIAYLPRNRKENGILKDMDILENGSIAIWPRISKLGFIDRERQNASFAAQAERLRVKMGKKTDLITSLSGGNQQKVILSRWLAARPKVLILDNPTQGVDVGAKEEIYDAIMRLADDGVAIIVLSSEAQEIIRVCGRAAVMYHGRLAGMVSGPDMNEHNIMRLATGS